MSSPYPTDPGERRLPYWLRLELEEVGAQHREIYTIWGAVDTLGVVLEIYHEQLSEEESSVFSVAAMDSVSKVWAGCRAYSNEIGRVMTFWRDLSACRPPSLWCFGNGRLDLVYLRSPHIPKPSLKTRRTLALLDGLTGVSGIDREEFNRRGGCANARWQDMAKW